MCAFIDDFGLHLMGLTFSGDAGDGTGLVK